MSDAELRAAAEYVTDDDKVYSGDFIEYRSRAEMLAKAWLAVHPADDGERLTPDRITAMLPSEATIGRLGRIDWFHYVAGDFRLWVNGELLRWETATVGDLRHIALALGVHLTESPPCPTPSPATDTGPAGGSGATGPAGASC